MTPHPAPRGTARGLLITAAALVLIETIAYLLLAALDLRDMTSSDGIALAVLLAGYGLAQLVAVRLLLLGRAGARAPLIVTQVLQVLVATNLRGDPGLALAVAVPALIVLGCVLAPPVTRALSSEPT